MSAHKPTSKSKSNWITRKEDFKFFSTKHTPLGSLTLAVLVLVLFFVGTITLANLVALSIREQQTVTNRQLSDAELFLEEYPDVEHSELFAYRSAEEIIDILEHGTGIVYLGFPECQWCQAYAPKLASLAAEAGIKKIYYFNIREDRAKNTEDYQKIVSLLGDRLQYNDEGKPTIFVPNVTYVIDGKIIDNDYETSKDLKGTKTPEEYWTAARLEAWQNRIKPLLERIKSAEGCADTCQL